jgi:tRNA-specific 2-thiouridylase
MSAPAAARIAFDGDEAMVTFDTPQFGVAPGQACVVYRGGRVLGGGWIRRRAERPEPQASAA